MSHTPEPWRVSQNERGTTWIVADTPVPEIAGTEDPYYGGHLIAESITPGNAARAVACVNACVGIPDDEILGVPEGGFIADLAGATRKVVEELRIAKALLDAGMLLSMGAREAGGYTNRIQWESAVRRFLDTGATS